MNCPNCKAEITPGSNFCEECGAQIQRPAAASAANLPEEDVCESCGASKEMIDAEGFCTNCGIQRRNPARDHMELETSPKLAGVSDRGIRHYRNEDFIALVEASGGAPERRARISSSATASPVHARRTPPPRLSLSPRSH